MRVVKENLPVVVIALLTIGAFIFIVLTSQNQVLDTEVKKVVGNDVLLSGKPKIRGETTASATLVEFSDFQCPACQAFFPTVKELEQKFSGKLKVVYRHFPIPRHEFARKAAEASEVANAQGKFWEYHDILFEKSPSLSVSELKQYAKDLGLDSEKFNKELDEGKYASDVEADYKLGMSIKINATPTFYLNGNYLNINNPQELSEKVSATIDSIK